MSGGDDRRRYKIQLKKNLKKGIPELGHHSTV